MVQGGLVMKWSLVVGRFWRNKKTATLGSCWGREVSEIQNTRFGVYLISMVEGVKIDSRF